MRWVALLLLASSATFAQQDNSNTSHVIFNMIQPGSVGYTDRAGNIVTITVIPDPNAGAKLDALTACSSAIAAIQPVIVMLLGAPTGLPVAAWSTPMKAAQPLLSMAKSKVDALLAVSP